MILPADLRQTSPIPGAAILGSAAHAGRAGCLWSWSLALATPPGRPALVGRRPPGCSCGRPAGPYHITGGGKETWQKMVKHAKFFCFVLGQGD